MQQRTLTPKIMKLVVRTHVSLYRLLKGRGGPGKNKILVTTIGRKSGLPRTKPLINIKDGNNFVVIASFRGAEKHPEWYVNLTANPHVTVENHGRVVPTIASIVTDEAEYNRLWSLMASIFPTYDDYQHRTKRKIPVVLLTPMQSSEKAYTKA